MLFGHFNVSVQDSLRVPLKTIQERIGHALTGSFTLDVYGHTLDWKAKEEAAQKLGDELAKAVADADKNYDSDCLTACQIKKLPFSENGSLLESQPKWLRGLDLITRPHFGFRSKSSSN
jgi:hypothetical protein